MHGSDELDEALGRGKFVGNIFHEHSDAERLSEGAQVLNTGHGGFEFSFVEFFVGIADVLDQKAERDLLGDFEGALISSMASIRWARSVEAMLTGGEPVRPIRNQNTKGVDGIQRNASGAEPVGNFATCCLRLA